MPAPFAPVALGLGLALFALFSGDDEKNTASSGGGGAPLPLDLTCEQALKTLPADLAGPAALLLTTVPTETTKTSAITLAVGFETSASQPGLDATTRAAFLKAAKCLRDWAASSPPATVTPVAVPPLPGTVTAKPKSPPLTTTGLAVPMNYGDANGVDWLVTQEASNRWRAELAEPPPSAAYASGLPFIRETKAQIVQAIDERAAVAAVAG